MGKEEVKEKGVFVQNDEVQEIIGSVPRWILRWSLIFVVFVFLSMAAICCIFHYPDVLQTSCTVTPVNTPEKVIAPVTGKITDLRVSKNNPIQKGDTLCILLDSIGKKYAVLSPYTCIAEAAISLSEGSYVNQGQEVFSLLIIHQSGTLCFIHIPADQASTIREGLEAKVCLPLYPEDDFGNIIGRITRISHFPDKNGFLTARIDFPFPIKTSTGLYIHVIYPMKGTAQILLGDKRLIEKILDL